MAEETMPWPGPAGGDQPRHHGATAERGEADDEQPRHRDTAAEGREAAAERSQTARVEAFSDGVMAIAITLLTLNLVVPSEAETEAAGGLLQALADRWPNYLAYLAAYLMIGIIWLNHRALFDKVRRLDHTLVWLNLFLLLTVAVLPFPTAILAAYVRDGGANAATAASVLGVGASAMASCWVLIWRHLRDHPHLLETGSGRDYAHREFLRARFGLLVYLSCIVIGIVQPLVALLAYIGIAVFYGMAREGVGRDVHETTTRKPDEAMREETAAEARG